MKDYYAILEVHRNASPEVIRRAYRTLVAIHHPDVANTPPKFAHQRMVDLNEAHDVLSDPARRAA